MRGGPHAARRLRHIESAAMATGVSTESVCAELRPRGSVALEIGDQSSTATRAGLNLAFFGVRPQTQPLRKPTRTQFPDGH